MKGPDLFGDGGEARPARARRPKAAKAAGPPAAVTRIIAAFDEAFERKFGFRNGTGYASAARGLKQLADAWGVDEVLATVEKFFRTTDPRVHGSNYTPRDFLFHAQRLRINGTKHPAARDERTSHNLDVVARATGRDAK